jgi:uncharacterized protein YdaU (DUF1376 family)
VKKPSAYLPLYGNDFFEAIAGYSDTVGLGYLRAIWHYWNHTGCEGLPDDDDYLRRICCCDDSHWANTKGIIFDNRYHFKLENGVWHQPRCRVEWQNSMELYAKKVRQTSAARLARKTT